MDFTMKKYLIFIYVAMFIAVIIGLHFQTGDANVIILHPVVSAYTQQLQQTGQAFSITP